VEVRRLGCGEVPELVSAGFDGELDPVEAELLVAHLAGCADCSQLAARLETANRRLRIRMAEAVPDLTAAIVAAAPRGRRGRPAPRWHGRRPAIAVAAAAVAAAVGLMLAVTIAGGPARPALAVDGAVTPVPMGSSGVAYLEIANRGGDDRLVGAMSPVARTVELHLTTVDQRGRTLMAAAESLVCSAHLALEPGSAHLMLLGVEQPLAVGDRFPLVLEFERSGPVEVDVEVVDWDVFGDRLASRVADE
jgi:copper(I)-binding protein